MAYSFINSSDEKFQKISDTDFVATQSLMAQVALSSKHQILTVQPLRQAVTLTTGTTALGRLKWQVFENAEIGKGQKLIYDLGGLYVGHFQLEIAALGSPMDSPLRLKTRFAERLSEFSEDMATVDSWLPLSWIQDDTRHIERLPRTVAFERRYSCRYIMVEAVGQSKKWHPQFSAAVFQAQSAVMTEHVPTPVDLPDWLQAVDEKCLITLRNTMQAVFEDGTKRDQRLWLLDFRMQAKVNYLTYQNDAIARNCLYLFSAFADDVGRMPADIFTQFEQPVADDLYWFDYQLQFLMALEEYVSATHDMQTLRDIYPVAQRTVKLIREELTQQLTVGQRLDIFVDWSTNCDKEAAVQAQVVMAMTHFIKLAQLMADDAQDTYVDFLQQLKQQTVKHYYDSEQQLFISGPQREISLLSQIYMLLADVLAPEAARRVIAKLKTQFDLNQTLTTPSTQGLLAEVLFKYGDRQTALELLHAYWFGMIEQGADAFWEVFDPGNPSYSPYGSILLNSYNFGWSAYPAYLIRQYL